MTDLEAALVEIASFLEERRWPYMLIGGLAVAIWGEPRATLDVDISVWVEPSRFEAAIVEVGAHFRTIPDALVFARRSRVVPIVTSKGVRGDLVLAALPEERRLIARAQKRQVGGMEIWIATVEDIVWMKLISERQKDLDDAHRLLRRYRATIDRGYLEPKLHQLAEALARSDIMGIYRNEMGNPSDS